LTDEATQHARVGEPSGGPKTPIEPDGVDDLDARSPRPLGEDAPRRDGQRHGVTALGEAPAYN